MSNPEAKLAIANWWAEHPMTYGEDHGSFEYVDENGVRTVALPGSREFFERADRRFYSWNSIHHLEDAPFGRLFDYAQYREKDVLEVGCGMGCMAMNWACQGARMTAVDLNHVAVATTRKRFDAFGLNGQVQQEDGESLSFLNNTFDFAYSWGVLHHSPNTAKSIGELIRVVKPGGRIGVMLYHRDSLLYRYLIKYVEGFLNLENEFLDELALASRYGDGARQEGNPHTWPVTIPEVEGMLAASTEQLNIRVLGTDVAGILDHWAPQFGSKWLPRSFVDAIARRWGWSLWIQARKPGAN